MNPKIEAIKKFRMDSFQDLKDKYMYHSQMQIERAKKATRSSKLVEIAQKSNVKLFALKKALKTKMDEKKKERYEKRLLMYKIANEEEEADYEKFFDENESECDSNKDEEEKQDQEMNEENNEIIDDKEDERKDEELDSQSMECTPTNLIEENRDLLTKMIFKSQQSQLDNEELLGLCSAKVASNDFIDDECEEEDDCGMTARRFDDDESELDEASEHESDEDPDESNDVTIKTNNLNVSECVENQTGQEEKVEKFDLVQDRLRRQEELVSDSDEEEMSFLNKFKFKKTAKIEESDDENSASNFREKLGLTSNDESNEPSSDANEQTDVYDNLNSQDSHFENNRESTFLESRSDFGKARFNLKEFIEDQAELSEEDKDKVSSDEEEEGDDEYEQDEIDENLPSEEEILKANNKMFLKQQMEEEKRELLEYQERFLEFGDLHDDGETRQRKFKWKNVDNVWMDNVKESSDSDEFDIDDSQIEYTSLHLKQLSEMDKSKTEVNSQDASQSGTQSSVSLSIDEKRKKKLMNTSLNKTHLNSYSTFDNSIFNKHMRTFKRTINGPANDIQSYIIKDKNLVNAMSVKSSVVAANQIKAKQLARSDFGSNPKKRKVEKNEIKKSIFDLF